MHYSNLVLPFLILIFSISCSQSKRVSDQMYITFDRIRYCVRRLNATHEIGCQSATGGSSGRMHMIDTNQDFNLFIQNSQLIDKFPSFVIFLNIDLFSTTNMDQLMSRLDSKLNGLLVYFKSNLTRPSDFSPDDSCPNHRSTYYLSQPEPVINWNPKGSSLFFRSFPFPIMLIDEQDDYQSLVDFYRKFNSSSSTLACGLELNTFQTASHSTGTCLRRGEISHSFLEGPEVHCDPVSGLNIYSKLPQSLTIKPNKRQPKSVILVLTTTDSFQMFIKTKGPSGGAQQPASGLLVFLSLAHLIGQEQENFNQQHKEIIFVTLDGDAFDYSASFRFIYDMEKGFFPSGNADEERIQIEHIHSIIEFQSLTFPDLKLFSYPSSLVNQTFINETIANNPTIVPMPQDSSLPPASSQIFLRQTNSAQFPVYIFTSTEQNRLLNHYYHSFFDDPSTLGINLTSLEFNTTTDFSRWIKSFTESFTQTLLQSFVGLTKNVSIEQDIVNNLVYCVLKNINCPLIQNITNQTIAKSFESFDQTSLPFSVNTYPISTTPTFAFIKNILSYFLRDRTFDSLNLTEAQCTAFASNDSFRFFNYVKGYLTSMNVSQSTGGVCVRSYLQGVDSRSPAFVINDYDFSQTTYPQWTESRWSIISLRLFVIPTRKHEVVTFVVGFLLFSVSFIVFAFLRFCTKLSLFKPSSS